MAERGAESARQCERQDSTETCLTHGVSEDRACGPCRAQGWPPSSQNDAIADCPTCDGEGVIYPRTDTRERERGPALIEAVRAYLRLYLLPANVATYLAPEDTHSRVAERCAPLLVEHITPPGQGSVDA